MYSYFCILFFSVDCAQPTSIAFVVEYAPELIRCPMLSGNAGDYFSSGTLRLREFLSTSGNVMPMANWLPLNASLCASSRQRAKVLLNYSSLDLKYSISTPKLVKLERQTEAGSDTLTLAPKQGPPPSLVAPFFPPSSRRTRVATKLPPSLRSASGLSRLRLRAHPTFEPLRATLRVQAFAPLVLAAQRARALPRWPKWSACAHRERIRTLRRLPSNNFWALATGPAHS